MRRDAFIDGVREKDRLWQQIVEEMWDVNQPTIGEAFLPADAAYGDQYETFRVTCRRRDLPRPIVCATAAGSRDNAVLRVIGPRYASSSL